MKVLITEKLSEHRYKTAEGYLVAVDAILARTGPQVYKHNQVYDGSTDEITDVEVDRKPEQVFSPQAIASFENKPLTIQHPNEPVTITNHRELYHGFARDIRRAVKRNGKILTGSKRPNVLQDGDQEVLVGNIIVTTSEAIEEIENGLEFLSCGYDCDITQTDKPEQINIRGNHIALCDNPRAGITMLQDNVELAELPVKHIVKVLTDALDSIEDGATITKAQILSQLAKHFKDRFNVFIYGNNVEISSNTVASSMLFDVIYRKNIFGKLSNDYMSAPYDEDFVLLKLDKMKIGSVKDALNYVVMCEQLYNGSPVRSRAPWIVFRTEDKLEAERFVRKNNDKTKSLVGFSQHYYIK